MFIKCLHGIRPHFKDSSLPQMENKCREDGIEYEDTIDVSSPYCNLEITRIEKENGLAVVELEPFF